MSGGLQFKVPSEFEFERSFVDMVDGVDLVDMVDGQCRRCGRRADSSGVKERQGRFPK